MWYVEEPHVYKMWKWTLQFDNCKQESVAPDDDAMQSKHVVLAID
jgi:hypothetical protein